MSTITVTVGDITLYGDAGHEFTLVSISGFDDLPSAKTEQDAWPRADGNAVPGTTYYDGRTITVNGYYATSTVEDTDRMMRRLRGMAGVWSQSPYRRAPVKHCRAMRNSGR